MKILAWDIETLPLIAATWRTYKMDIPTENIIQPTTIVCAAWKDVEKGKVEHVSLLDCPSRFKKSVYDDYHVVKKLHEVLSGADVLLAQNGDRFDLKKFSSRALFHKFGTLPYLQTIDTLKVARKRFGNDSNRLDFLGRFTGTGRKKETRKHMWLDIVQADYPPFDAEPDRELAESTIKEMVAYNKQDVKLLIEVYKELRPYMTTHPNKALHGGYIGCPACGSKDFTKKGYRYTHTGQYQAYQCRDCGKRFQEASRCGRTSVKAA